MAKTKTLLPLREPTFFILLSLAQGEKHGYAIIKESDQLSQGRIKLSTSTLYEALFRLLDQKLIERVDERESPTKEKRPGRPRKFYRLTEMGQHILEAEIGRMQNLVMVARLQLGNTQPTSAI